MQRIGVEGSLTNISDALRAKGYDVVELEGDSNAQNLDFCVVTGIDSNMMGMQDVQTRGSVIEASGLTADEVIKQIESKMKQ